MFHYSFSAPLQAVTEIMEKKDATVLVSAAWRWASGAQGSKLSSGPFWPPGAALGRMHPVGPADSSMLPVPGSYCPSPPARPVPALCGPWQCRPGPSGLFGCTAPHTALTQDVPCEGANAEGPPQERKASVSSHLTQLLTLLQLLLQLKRPAKEGEQRLFSFLSYDQAPNSAGHVEKGSKRTTKYKASQGVGERLVQGTALFHLAVHRARAGRGCPLGVPGAAFPAGFSGGPKRKFRLSARVCRWTGCAPWPSAAGRQCWCCGGLPRPRGTCPQRWLHTGMAAVAP